MEQAATIVAAVFTIALLAISLLVGGPVSVLVVLTLMGVIDPILAFEIAKLIAITVGGAVIGVLVPFVISFMENLGQSAAEFFSAWVVTLPLLLRRVLGQSLESQGHGQHDGRQQTPEVEGGAPDSGSE